MLSNDLRIYLDYNSSTPCDPEISDIFQHVNSYIYGNPHASEHAWGWDAEEIIEVAKADVASFINALPDEIIFTSGASEANNLAIIGTAIAAKLKKDPKNKIIVSAIEHKCVLNAAYHLRDLFGFEIAVIPVHKSGIISLKTLEEEIDRNTLLVSIMAVNNEIGTCQPLIDIGRLCKKHNTIFHVDAAQAAYLDIDVIHNNIDLLSLSGHKIYAPKGIGALYISQDVRIKPSPIIHGGGQQNGFRSGTLSPALTASIAKAVCLVMENKDSEISRLLKLRDTFLHELMNLKVSFQINGDFKKRHPGNLNVQFHGVDVKALIMRLQPRIAVSTGSACNSGEIRDSYVLKAIGLTGKQIESSLRIAFGRFTTEKEVLEAAVQISNEINVMMSLV